VHTANCFILSQIGSPINTPQAVSIAIETHLPEGILNERITTIVDRVLDDWAIIREGFLERRWPLF